MQSSVNDALEDHLAQNDKTRKQNRRFKKLLRRYETEKINNTQIIEHTQKEFEESITKEHAMAHAKIFRQLDRYEDQIKSQNFRLKSLSMNRKRNYEGIMDDAVRKIKHFFERIEGNCDEDDSVLEPLQEINKVLSFERLDTLSVVTESQPNTEHKQRPQSVPKIPLEKINRGSRGL